MSRENDFKLVVLDPVEGQLNKAGTKYLKYSIQMEHTGLNEYKLITARDLDILQIKADAQGQEWVDKWENLKSNRKLTEKKRNTGVLFCEDDLFDLLEMALYSVKIPIYRKKPISSDVKEYIILNTIKKSESDIHGIVSYDDRDLNIHGFKRINQEYKKVRSSAVTYKSGSTHLNGNMCLRKSVINTDVVIQYFFLNINYYFERINKRKPSQRKLKVVANQIKSDIKEYYDPTCLFIYHSEHTSGSFMNLRFGVYKIHFT